MLVSNGLSSMGFSVPGALAAKLACPRRRVLAATGDGAFLMNSQELETAVRERVPFVVPVRRELRGARLPDQQRRRAAAHVARGAGRRRGVGDRGARRLLREPATDGQAGRADRAFLSIGRSGLLRSFG
ncbi:thiamine pyrophosphate-dependent enzyme [Nonomuraea sp. PA05]|uniref:thiamine pyrophosphate-dependent enzyme n=1 Tax=Nonomuraea sp. PA05 TaxID=2604466 RepID=UPI0021CC6B7E|nr:thiamine pyrophosphate-dependent enzyme [Nonomuraea sp. PA05]